MRLICSFIFIMPLFANFVLADAVPLEHQSHCRKWENGACVEGALTDLANSIRNTGKMQAATTESSCGKICKDACPNCSKCNLCSFCWIYNSESCKGVGYYTDPETCAEAQTESCCDLCEAHCGENGACADGEYCKGGDKSTSTIVKCIEQTQGEICEKCVVN